MRKTILLLVSLAFTGCSSLTYENTKADGTITKFKVSAPFFNNAAFKNLAVDKTTKTTTSGLSLAGANSDPNPEAITTTGSALGDLLGTALEKAAKGAK